MIRRFDNLLLKRLPKTKGEYIENAPIGKKTWFRTGGLAEVLFEPHDKNDLISFNRTISYSTASFIIFFKITLKEIYFSSSIRV